MFYYGQAFSTKHDKCACNIEHNVIGYVPDTLYRNLTCCETKVQHKTINILAEFTNVMKFITELPKLLPRRHNNTANKQCAKKTEQNEKSRNLSPQNANDNISRSQPQTNGAKIIKICRQTRITMLLQ